MTSNTHAVIDADFYIKMTKHACDKGALFFQLLKDLGVQAVMHKYVAEVELKRDVHIKSFTSDGWIKVLDYSDYLVSEQDKLDYKEYFYSAYERINRFDFPENEDVYTYDEKGESLGEIRSMYLAKKMGYHYFMSDDGHSRTLAKALLKAPEVLSIYEALVKCKEKGTSITLKQLNPTISNVFRERPEKLVRIREIFAE